MEFWASLKAQLVSACNAGDPDLIAGSGRSAGGGIGYPIQYSWASLVAQMVKNPPAMWETWVPSLGWEDPLEKVTNSYPLQYSYLENFMDRGAWWATVGYSGLQSQRVGHNWETDIFSFFSTDKYPLFVVRLFNFLSNCLYYWAHPIIIWSANHYHFKDEFDKLQVSNILENFNSWKIQS